MIFPPQKLITIFVAFFPHIIIIIISGSTTTNFSAIYHNIREMKISARHLHCKVCFPANNACLNPDAFFSLKDCAMCNTRGVIPQNFSALGLEVLEELGNKQTSKHTNTH